jgi:hypothetical protein
VAPSTIGERSRIEKGIMRRLLGGRLGSRRPWNAT